MTVQRRLLSLVGAAALASAFTAVAIAPAHGASNATVSILHGVPDATVDVYANGKALLEDFEPGTLTDPQMLPAGSYDLKVVKAGDGADGDAIMSANNVKVPAGANVTVVAHLTESGKPTRLIDAPILSAFGMVEEELAFAAGTKFSDPDLRSWESLGQGGTVRQVEWTA